MKSFKKSKIITNNVFLIILSLINLPVQVFAQQPESVSLDQEYINYNKLYLHTDRDFYFAGDTIRFKAYYIHGQVQQYIKGVHTMYSELLDAKGEVRNVQIWPVNNGTAIGQISIPKTLDPGNYKLRAYTDFQKQFGEDAFFSKSLVISRIEEGTRVSGTKQASTPKAIDITFLPEGGELLAGMKNRVGIKAIDENGLGISVKGNIIDSSGKIVSAFETKYRGMGSIDIFPQEGEVYKAHVEGFDNTEFDFGEVVNEGIKIEFAGSRAGILTFGVTTNSKTPDTGNYSFAILNKGQVIFHQNFQLKGNSFPIRVHESAIPAGINRFVLLDSQMKPISERLYFSQNFDVDSIRVQPDREEYLTRSKVECTILDQNKDGGWSDLSIAVVNMDAVSDLPSQNILSWLLVNSELKGDIGAPSDYFVDEDNVSSGDKLDLLMLTHGWSRYIWNTLPEINVVTDESNNITITGKAERSVGSKPIVDGVVTLNLISDNFNIIDEAATDEEGRFVFKNIFFMDNAKILLQAKNEKGKAGVVHIDPIINSYSTISEAYLPVKATEGDFPMDLYKQQYYNEKALKDFHIEQGDIILENVEVIGEKKPEEEERYRIYKEPSAGSLEVSQKDIRYDNVFKYLQGRVAGLTIRGNSAMIHGPSSFGGLTSYQSANEPIYVADGVQVSGEELANIPMGNIERVEVLKGSDAAIYGVRGGNGAIVVYTKKEAENFEPDNTSLVAQMITGYSSYREFYSPIYTPENLHAPKPDNRITLFWEPQVYTETGIATVSFYTSDDTSRFRILVEGITMNGKVCLGMGEFEVSGDKSIDLEN